MPTGSAPRRPDHGAQAASEPPTRRSCRRPCAPRTGARGRGSPGRSAGVKLFLQLGGRGRSTLPRPTCGQRAVAAVLRRSSAPLARGRGGRSRRPCGSCPRRRRSASRTTPLIGRTTLPEGARPGGCPGGLWSTRSVERFFVAPAPWGRGGPGGSRTPRGEAALLGASDFWPCLSYLDAVLRLELTLARVDLRADRHGRDALDRDEPADRRLLRRACIGTRRLGGDRRALRQPDEHLAADRGHLRGRPRDHSARHRAAGCRRRRRPCRRRRPSGRALTSSGQLSEASGTAVVIGVLRGRDRHHRRGGAAAAERASRSR